MLFKIHEAFYFFLNIDLKQNQTSVVLSSGIVTAGSDEYYMESYILSFSKDRKNWKLYKDAASKERKVGVLLNAFTAPTS